MEWFLVFLLAVSCAAQDHLDMVRLPATVDLEHTRITNGSSTEIGNYPYVVQVQHKEQLWCGGSLVTMRHVLTAAHCFFDDRGIISHIHYTIRAGTTELYSGGFTRSVERIVIHEHYNDIVAHDNDVAIMFLTSSFIPSESIAIAMIPYPGEEVPDDASVWHVGWGKTSESNISKDLQEVEIKTIGFEICKKRYQKLEKPALVTKNMICAGLLDEGGKDACKGDSGGPLVYNGIVVGVTSWGKGCGDSFYPGVSTKTSAFSDWIEKTVNFYKADISFGDTIVIMCFLFILTLFIRLMLVIFSFLQRVKMIRIRIIRPR